MWRGGGGVWVVKNVGGCLYRVGYGGDGGKRVSGDGGKRCDVGTG